MELKVENKLILAASGLELSETCIAQINEMIPQINDWDYFTDNAILNGVGPILHKNFSSIPVRQIIPNVTLEKVEQSYFMSLRRNMILYEHFRKAASAIMKEGFSVIALKGISLAESVYRDIGLRQMTDVDLLLKEGDAEKCWNILRDNGYQYREHKKTEFIKNITEVKHLPALYRNGIYIELHTKTFFDRLGYQVNVSDYWERAVPVTIAGLSVKKLCPEHQLQHTCMHLDEHYKIGKPQLHSFVDISAVISANDQNFDWNYLVSSCDQYRCSKAVFKYLQIASRYFDVRLPEFIRHKAAENTDDITERLFIHYLQEYNKPLPVDITNQGYEQLRYISGAGNKFRYLLHDIFPSKKFMLRRYRIRNKNFVYLYYIPRMGTGIKRMSIQLMKQITLAGRRRKE